MELKIDAAEMASEARHGAGARCAWRRRWTDPLCWRRGSRRAAAPSRQRRRPCHEASARKKSSSGWRRRRSAPVPTGIDHGTITAVSSGHPYRDHQPRRDVSTDGRRATVAFTDDWEEDAARRDFTINALSADPQTGESIDYFGGTEDLRARRVRFIGEPLERIAEDHLADPALLPLPRALRRGRSRCAMRSTPAPPRERPHGPVPRTDRRRVAEAARGRGPVADRGDHARTRHPSPGPARDRTVGAFASSGRSLPMRSRASNPRRSAPPTCRASPAGRQSRGAASQRGSSCRTRRANGSAARPTPDRHGKRAGRSPIIVGPNARSIACCSAATPEPQQASRSGSRPAADQRRRADRTRADARAQSSRRPCRRSSGIGSKAGFPEERTNSNVSLRRCSRPRDPDARPPWRNCNTLAFRAGVTMLPTRIIPMHEPNQPHLAKKGSFHA